MTKTVYQWPQYARLEPRTEWTASRLTDDDFLTLDDGARCATQHIGTEVTPGDFLRAAARGEIRMHAVCPRTVTMVPCRTGDKPMHLPERSLPTLPLSACMGLANVGRADWRTYDGHERVEIFGGELCRFTQWQLPEGEPDLVTLPGDCRVTGRDVRALADAFRAPTAAGTTAPAAAEPVPGVAEGPTALESPKIRRARLLDWLEDETRISGKRGALARVTTRELASRPTADRANIGKAIKKARAERAAATRAGPFAGLGA